MNIRLAVTILTVYKGNYIENNETTCDRLLSQYEEARQSLSFCSRNFIVGNYDKQRSSMTCWLTAGMSAHVAPASFAIKPLLRLLRCKRHPAHLHVVIRRSETLRVASFCSVKYPRSIGSFTYRLTCWHARPALLVPDHAKPACISVSEWKNDHDE